MHIQTCVQWLPDKCSLHKTTVEEKLVSREKKCLIWLWSLSPRVNARNFKGSKCLKNIARRARGVQDVKHRHQIFLSSEVFWLTIGNDVMVAQFVSLCLVRVTFQEISKEMDVKTVNVIVKKQINNNFSYSPLLWTMEMASKNSKLCRETTHLQLVVDLLTSLGERGWSHYTHTHTPYPTPQTTSKKPYNSPVSRIARQP